MHNLILLLFAVAGGLTLSGITANLYRMLAKRPDTKVATWVHYLIMAFAGPSVLFENSTRSFRKKECSRAAYGLAVGLAAYWAFILGAVVVRLVV
jgi:hypothetical protein